MRRFGPMILVILLVQPTALHAQTIQWKAIACPADSPDFARGITFTVYFSDDGKIHFNGTQYSGTVTFAELRFCSKPHNQTEDTCFTISRLSGRFSSIAKLRSCKRQLCSS
jgi:hypothetical protein